MNHYLIYTVGLPGSGKSTFANEWLESAPIGDRALVNKDQLRRMMHVGHYAGHRTENLIIRVQRAAIMLSLFEGFDVMVHGTNLRSGMHNYYKLIAAESGAKLRYLSFADVSTSECFRRNALRDDDTYVPVDKMWHMYGQLEEWKVEQQKHKDWIPYDPRELELEP